MGKVGKWGQSFWCGSSNRTKVDDMQPAMPHIATESSRRKCSISRAGGGVVSCTSNRTSTSRSSRDQCPIAKAPITTHQPTHYPVPPKFYWATYQLWWSQVCRTILGNDSTAQGKRPLGMVEKPYKTILARKVWTCLKFGCFQLRQPKV